MSGIPASIRPGNCGRCSATSSSGALQRPDKEVYFEQVHTPGRLAQSDFTRLSDLRVTLGGVPFQHLVYHLVLTYSNVEAVSVCCAESFEALAEGLERCL